MLITWIICFSVVAGWQVDIGVVHSLGLAIRFLLQLASLPELWRMQSNHNISLCFNSDYNSTTKKIVCFCCVLYFRADVGYALLAVFVISMSPRPSSPLTMSVSSQSKRPREPGGGLSLASGIASFPLHSLKPVCTCWLIATEIFNGSNRTVWILVGRLL